jgi:1-acyl-sn-glycerol-3-phosphate acyltransferase
MAFVPVTISVVFWTYVVLSSLLFFPVAVLLFAITAPFDRRRRAQHRFSSFWAFHYLWLMPLWRVKVEGRERIRPDKTYVMVANHQSLLDILVLYGLFRPFKWVSKIENFRIPFIGWNMYLADYVKLTRGRKGSITRMMRDCRAQLDKGCSIMMFPEGTRSPDGEMRRFRDGAFVMAYDAGIEVVPIALDGTHDALPKKGVLVKKSEPTRIRVRVLEPISPDQVDSPEEMTRMAHERIRDELNVMRGINP